MPIYEYECQSCGRRTETMQKIADPPLATCPVCQGGPMKRLVSAPAFHLKGSGWYVTDYARKDGGGKPKESDGGGDKAADKPAADAGGGDKATKAAAGDSGSAPSSSSSSSSSTSGS